MRAAKKIEAKRRSEREVQCLSFERFLELQTLYYASRTAPDSIKHQNWVLTDWADEVLWLLHPLRYVATNPVTLLSIGEYWAMFQSTRIMTPFISTVSLWTASGCWATLVNAPVSDFPGSNLVGALWAFGLPLPFARPCFLVALSSNELLRPSVRTGSQQAHEKRPSSCGATTLIHGQITHLCFSFFCDATILLTC